MELVQRQNIKEINDAVFGDVGLNCEPVSIVLKDGAVPYSITAPRRVSFPILPKLKWN